MGPALEPLVPREYPVWYPLVLPIEAGGTVLEEGDYMLVLRREAEETPIGRIKFIHISAPPLTPERIAAIQSNLLASKWVRCKMACRYCNQEVRAYAGLERSAKSEQEGWGWYQDLPETLVCNCGKTTFNLSSIRRDLHGLLGSTTIGNGAVTFEEMYTRAALEAICLRFGRLLDRNPKEEEIQTFIKQNPILLHHFSAEQILLKPPVLTQYNADFAVLSSAGKLTLIEIERPDLQLLRKDGEPHTELQHAVTQVQRWFYVLDRDRDAALRCMKLSPDEVSSIRGVVIAGRDRGKSEQHLRELKWRDWGKRIDFYTYDDLLAELATLIQKLHESRAPEADA
jgi:hypothetical protein